MESSSEETKAKTKGLFLIQPGAMTREEIERVESMTGMCFAECADPESVRYMDPVVDADVGAQANAALKLVRCIAGLDNATFNTGDALKSFVRILIDSREVSTVKKVKR